MRKICVGWVLVFVVGGCSLTTEERQSIIDMAAEKAGEEAYKKAYEAAVKRGLSEEEAKKFAEIAREEGAAAAMRIAEKAVPQAEDKKRSKTSAALASILLAVLQLGFGALGKKGASA